MMLMFSQLEDFMEVENVDDNTSNMHNNQNASLNQLIRNLRMKHVTKSYLSIPICHLKPSHWLDPYYRWMFNYWRMSLLVDIVKATCSLYFHHG